MLNQVFIWYKITLVTPIYIVKTVDSDLQINTLFKSSQFWAIHVPIMCIEEITYLYNRFLDLNILGAARLVHSDLRINRISFFLFDKYSGVFINTDQ